MSRSLLLSLVLLLPVGALAQARPESIVLNGGFESRGGWSMPPSAKRVPSDRGGQCLRMDGQSGLTQEIPTDGIRGTYTVAADLKCEGVTAAAGAGYAYVAVYQLGQDGQLVAFKDFGQLFGTKDWQRFTYTFTVAGTATTLSLRCGIYNAAGTAWFDNWTCVAGTQAYALDQVEQFSLASRPAQGAAAVLREPGLPVVGKASSPERLGKLLTQAGMTVDYLSAAELADARRLRPDRYHFVVLPYGQTFPADARRNLLQYLHLGGSFISTGGYVFNNLLLQKDGRWVEERKVVAAELDEALKHSVLPDGGFEHTADAPVGGTVADGRWRRDHAQCEIVNEDPHEGRQCARVQAEPGVALDERKWYLDVPPIAGGTYRVSGWIKTRNVTGTGFAYLACYQWDAEGKLLKHVDYAQVRGTNGWQQFTHDFTPEAGTARIFLKMGLYRATGTAWFDDLRLSHVTRLRPQTMNTSTGEPGDGLGLAPWQIGAFDAGFPLRRVTRTLPGEEQYLFARDGRLDGALTGWAAAGVQGYDNARWVPLLDARDRFGRQRGAAGALMLNYNGYYAGSQWAFFGAENRDLFDGSSPWLDAGLVKTAQFMVRGLFLRNLKTDLTLYRDGETVKAQVAVQNGSGQAQPCTVQFTAYAEGKGRPVWTQRVEASVPGGGSAEVSAQWQPGAFGADTYQVRAVLLPAGKPQDEMRTGFMVQRPQTVAQGPTLRFKDNYFECNGRPLFLFGSDTYANTYRSSTENPWTWHLDHIAARDYGLNLYENLQYCNSDYTYSEAEWRSFEAMAQSTQREGLVFMPCQLCGHNVAIDEKLLEKEAAECRAYGEHMRPFPGLLYYLNGDFQFERDDKVALTELWNQWLAEKYKSVEALKASWGEEVYGEWGKLAYPPPTGNEWHSVRRCDQARFDVWLNRRWVQRNVQAVRKSDPEHPITSEYYQRPYNGIDLILSLGDQDVANIGYFDAPERDIDLLPMTLRLNDLRARGKSVSLGEYGVKTHPAWGPDNGARGYHPRRTEEEQKQLFMAVAHYGMGMGASKVQNWCLRDASEWVFPWGLFYPNGRVPKDVAYWHRNLSLVWRFLEPKWTPPSVTVLLPDNLRLGNGHDAGVQAALNCFAALVDLNVNFNTVNEWHVEALTPTTKVLLWPSPLCPGDETYAAVRRWVEQGGKLLVTGDISRDWDRKRTRTARLRELCGVEFVADHLEAPARGWVEVKPLTAKIEAQNPVGTPLLLRNVVGKGEVVYCTDAIELGGRKESEATLRALYELVIPAGERMAGGPGLRLCRQPLRDGGEFAMAFNTDQLGGPKDVRLPVGRDTAQVRVAGHYPAFTATAEGGKLVAAGASGELSLAGKKLIAGTAQALALSLDRQGLEDAAAVLLCPMGEGTLALNSRHKWRDPVVLLGDIEDGQWKTLQTLSGAPKLTLDETTMTCLALVCEKGEQGKWTGLVTQALRRPWEVKGY